MEHRPVAPLTIGWDSTYLYLTLYTFTDKGFAALLPKLDGPSFSWFIEQVQGWLERKCLFVADGATAHVKEYFDERKLAFVRLPAACPDSTRLSASLKRCAEGQWLIFQTLEQAQERVQNVVQQLAEEVGRVVSITCFPYLKNTSYKIWISTTLFTY
jgi:4-alpha-glucanotransferase